MQIHIEHILDKLTEDGIDFLQEWFNKTIRVHRIKLFSIMVRQRRNLEEIQAQFWESIERHTDHYKIQFNKEKTNYDT